MTCMISKHCSYFQRGVSVTEFILVMPVFFVLLFGIFEFTYIYKAKATLNTAAFEAVRAGTLNHGDPREMRRALAKGMAPIYMRGSGSRSILGMSAAYLRAETDAALIDALHPHGPIRIISPSPEVFAHFSVKRFAPVSTNQLQMQEFIPVDFMLYRDSQNVTISMDDGTDFEMNIQDANLLKIQVFWCYPMKTPFVSWLIRAAAGNSLFFAPTPEQQACNARSLTGTHYLALSSQAVMRMQTHFIQY